MAFKLIAFAFGVSAVNAMPAPLSFEDAVAVRATLNTFRDASSDGRCSAT
jgi:hypothetical protein